MNIKFSQYLDKTIDVLNASKSLERVVEDAVNALTDTIRQGRRVFICGNGGSAADSQHWAAELVGKFRQKGSAISAIALTTDTSAITAIANDFGFEFIFERQLSAHGIEGDCLIAISTSGNSKNVVRAVKKAKEMQIETIGILGKSGGLLKEIVDYAICVPSVETDLIQHAHILIGHFLMGEIEERFRDNS